MAHVFPTNFAKSNPLQRRLWYKLLFVGHLRHGPSEAIFDSFLCQTASAFWYRKQPKTASDASCRGSEGTNRIESRSTRVSASADRSDHRRSTASLIGIYNREIRFWLLFNMSQRHERSHRAWLPPHTLFARLKLSETVRGRPTPYTLP